LAEKWRRCSTCRKVRPVEDFDGGETSCRQCLTAPVRKTRAASTVTSRRVSLDAGSTERGPASGAARPANSAAAERAAAAAQAAAARAVAPRDLRGRGDVEVRSRRARVRALDRLAEDYADDFARLLAEERRSEGLS
jgi:hypothetical protein